MGGESKDDINRLRAQARRLGLAIRTQRAPGAPKHRLRAYSLIESETGTVVSRDLQGLVAVRAQLWWIVRDRRRALSGETPPSEVPHELCPSCGTPRVAAFRSCLTCGFDFQAPGEAVPGAPSGLGTFGADDAVGRSMPGVAAVRRPPLGERVTTRLSRLVAAIVRPDQLWTWRLIAGMAVAGVLVGALVTLALEAFR